ncbi:MAG: peptide chain release factor 2 [Proteobacteria bacterium]|nr:peptide chain release factor 2 [Pseudomonadota bacterium]MBU1586058.1 peptide chain release factor 2 [Pseudomonadota bacterium]MBU2455640.1 peptide chain release factor 2 [Pseudomonadota bacterium]MBU2629756.1 peptide chain release factor 2 [Pseudomonadota bacterium]
MQKPTNSRSIFDLPVKLNRLRELEHIISKEDFWNDADKATDLLKERTILSNLLENWESIYKDIEDAEILLELALEESDKESEMEVAGLISVLEKRIKKFSVQITLDSEDDARDALVSINAGAGGTDSQDWAEMLFRMYTRWMDKKGYKYQIIDYQPGDEAGVKGVMLRVSGENCYGFMKVESGVHRLVRISPYNASGKRHTSFASVFVYPEIKDEIKIDIDESELRIDVYRASGAGGQHVNKTSSAVRITHLPTGVVVQCQQEPSQHRNKEIAFKVLKSRLYQLEKDKQDKKMQTLHDGKDEIAWGNQIRSYVLHPYRMVKDHRTDFEVGDVDRVLNGDLDPFIEGVLLS